MLHSAFRGIAFAGAIACAVATPNGARSAPDPYRFNIILSLSGSATFLGKQEQKSFQIEEGLINKMGGIKGRPVKFVYYDDQSSPQVGLQLLKRIVSEKAPFVLGSSIQSVCNAMLPLVDKGPLLYCISNSFQPPVGSFGFSGNVSSRDTTTALIRFFSEKGWKRIALITSTDATGQEAERGITAAVDAFKDEGMSIVERAHFALQDVSVSAQIERIRTAKPDAIVAWSTGTPIATVFKGIVQGGLDIPVATTNANQTLAQMNAYEAFLPKNLYMPCPAWLDQPEGEAAMDPQVVAAHRGFVQAFKDAGETPDGGSILAWDLPLIMVDALGKLSTDATAAQLHDYISKIDHFGGLNGVYDFRKNPQRGLDASSAIVTRWNPARKYWDVVSRPGGSPISK
jgi:branched-chain amino acid transport system substrate-binding protein